MGSMISVEGLTKKYGKTLAVDDLSLTVEEGALFAFLGTNGAGKSTSISCMTTLLDYNAGTIMVGGKTVGADDAGIREKIGIVFQQSLLDPRLTVEENLKSRASFYGTHRDRVDELIDMIDMRSFQSRRYGVLSGGEKRRVDIARALLNRPTLLFLDEPTTGLDPQSRDQVWSVISQLQAELGLTVLLTTHYMAETEHADRVLVIDRGRAIAEGTPFELRARYSAPHLSLSLRPGTGEMSLADRVRAAAPSATGGAAIDEVGGAAHLTVPDSATALGIIDALRPELIDFEFRQGSMDDVFLTLTAPQKRKS